MAGTQQDALAQFTARRRDIFYLKTDLPVPDAELQNLRNRSDEELGLTSEVLRAAAAAAFPGQQPTLQRMERQGTFHRLFRAEFPDGTRRVMRFNVGAGDGGGYILRLEAWATSRARAAGIPAPAVLATETGGRVCPMDFQVVEWVSDRSLTEFDELEPDAVRLLEKFGGQLAKLHKVSVHGFGWFDVAPLYAQPAAEPAGLFRSWADYLSVQLEAHVEACQNLHALGKAEGARVLDLFAGLIPGLADFTPALLHGDPGGHNIATDGENITALLDWEDCLAGDPIYEVAFWATFQPERRHAAFLSGYRSVRPLPDDFEIRFWLYFLRVSLAKTVHRHRFGYKDRPDRPPAAQRVRTALLRLEEAVARPD